MVLREKVYGAKVQKNRILCGFFDVEIKKEIKNEIKLRNQSINQEKKSNFFNVKNNVENSIDWLILCRVNLTL